MFSYTPQVKMNYLNIKQNGFNMVQLSRWPAWQSARSREENGILGRHAERAITPRSIDQSSSMADQTRQIKLAAAKKKVK